jgi:hypothetical protein
MDFRAKTSPGSGPLPYKIAVPREARQLPSEAGSRREAGGVGLRFEAGWCNLRLVRSRHPPHHPRTARAVLTDHRVGRWPGTRHNNGTASACRRLVPQAGTTFSDAIAAVRRVLWCPPNFSMSRQIGDIIEIPQLALMFAVKDERMFRPPAATGLRFFVRRLVHKAGGRVQRRRFNKLSCAGWLPHFRCSVSGVPRLKASVDRYDRLITSTRVPHLALPPALGTCKRMCGVADPPVLSRVQSHGAVQYSPIGRGRRSCAASPRLTHLRDFRVERRATSDSSPATSAIPPPHRATAVTGCGRQRVCGSRSLARPGQERPGNEPAAPLGSSWCRATAWVLASSIHLLWPNSSRDELRLDLPTTRLTAVEPDGRSPR